MIHRAVLSILAASAISHAAPAQASFETLIGTPLGCSAGLDWVVAQLPLGFGFTFPGAATPSSTIDVTANGRVLPGGTLSTGNNGDFTPDPAELLGNLHPTLAVFWKDMNFTSPLADDVYFNTFPGRAVVTWKDAVQFGGTTKFTVQCQLFADGRIQFLYGATAESSLALAVVGISPGSGAADPGETDFTDLALGDLSTNGVATSYEFFDLFTDQNDVLDLQSFSIEFTPDGSGGWNLVGPPVAATEEFGLACEKAMQFIPDGVGGYTVIPCGNCFDATPGADLGLVDDSTATVLLGFQFEFPGGSTTNQITLSDNGRLVPAGIALVPDNLPSPFDLLSPSFPTIAGMWTNWDPSAGGSVTFRTTANQAWFTWDGVVQFGESVPITHQVILDDTGQITFVYRDTQRLIENPVTTIVGITEGNALGTTSQSDFTALPIVGGSTIYEWINTTFGGGETWTYQLGLTALTTPNLGSVLDVQLDGIQTSSTGAAILIGAFDPMIDLSVNPLLGLPGCSLYSSADIATVNVGIVGTDSTVLSIPVPASTPIGLQLFMQGVTLTPGATPLGVNLSNGLRVIAGT